MPRQLHRVARLCAAGGQVVLQACANTLDIPGQTQVVEVVAFAGFIGEQGTALGSVFQGVQLADHDGQVGLLGGRGG